jgi:hypothetical protein
MERVRVSSTGHHGEGVVSARLRERCVDATAAIAVTAAAAAVIVGQGILLLLMTA